MTPEYEDWLFDLMEHPSLREILEGEEAVGPGRGTIENHADTYGYYASGWSRPYPLGEIGFYNTLRKKNTKQQKLILGPWLHARFNSHSGDVDFGQAAAIDKEGYSKWMLRWFDFSLKGLDTGIAKEKPVKVFVMGGGDGKKNMDGRMRHGGRWREETSWPLTQTRFTKYYLGGNGGLSAAKPSVKQCSSSYLFDPKNPVPSIGGTFSFSELIRLPGAENLTITDRLTPVLPHGAQDQRERRDVFICKSNLPLEARRDILDLPNAAAAARYRGCGAPYDEALGILVRYRH